MLSSPPPSIDSAASLRALLGIRDSSDFRCHGVTKKTTQCRVRVAAKDAVAVEVLLDKAALATNREEKGQILRKIAPLALCKSHHQNQQSALVAVWEKLIEEADVTIKAEPDDGVNTMVEEVPPTAIQKQASRKRRESLPKHGDLKQKVDIKVEHIKTEPAVRDRGSPSHMPQLDTSSEHPFKPYSAHRKTPAVNSYIKSVLSKPLTESALEAATRSSPGHVYIYTFTSKADPPTRYLKIGHSKDLKNRLQQIQRNCRQEPTILCDFRTNLHIKVERIVHAHLANQRLQQAKPCDGCGCCHQEWFEVQLPTATTVIGLWTEWSLREPYDETGVLKPEWRKKLDRVDLSDENCWEEFVYG